MKMEQFNRENNTAEQSVRTVSQKYANKGKLRRVIALLSAVVVFFTMNTLKFEADTLEHYAMCGFEAHVHDETCLDENGQVVCGMDEHIHTDACFQQRPVKPEPTVLDEYVPLNTQVVLSSPMDALDAPVEEVSVSLGDDEGEAYDDGALDVTYDEPAIPEIHEYRMDGEVAFLSDVLNGVGMSVSNITSVGEIIDDSILVEGDDFTVESAEDIPGEYIIRAVRDFDRAELGIVDDAGVESIWLLNGIGVAPTQPVEAAATEEDIIYEETAAEASETAAADDGIETEEQQPVEEAVTETQEPAIEEALQETEAELEESPADDVTEAENETVENVSEENVTENTEEPEIEETADEAVTDGEPADEAETGLDEAETENTEATEAENTEVTGAENTEVTETENNEVTEVENTEATEEENTEATETENTEVTEAENTEAIETESVETDETEVEDAAQEAEIAETETEIEDQAVRSVALDFTNYIATDDHAAYLYDAANAFVLVNAAEITSADGVETVTEEEIAASEDATLVITGDGEYELDGVIYTVSGLVLPEKVVTNAEQNVTIATANDESTLLNVEPVFEESAEGYADIFSLFQAAEADPTLLSRLSDALFGVAYAEEVRELQMKLFNIGLQSTEDGSEVEPGTAVRVTTFFDAIEGVDFALYHIVDNQPVLVENAVVVEDGRAIGFDFEIDSLSPFALVYYTVTTREGETFTGYSLKTDEKALNAQQLLETLGVQAIATGVTCNDESVAIDGLDIALPESFEKIALTIEAGVDKYEITLLTGDELTAAVGDYAVSLDLSNAGLDDSASYKVEITQQPATDEEVAAVEAALSETLEDGTRKIAHVSDLEMVDISIINTETGLAVEPQGSVAVSLTRGGEAIPTVVHFRNDGEVETLPVENGTFTTDSFSAFTGSYTVEYAITDKEIDVTVDFKEIVINGVDFDKETVISALNDGVAVNLDELEKGYGENESAVQEFVAYSTADNKVVDTLSGWAAMDATATEGLSVVNGQIRVTADGTVTLTDGETTIVITIVNYTRLLADAVQGEGVSIDVLEGEVPAGSKVTYTERSEDETAELAEAYEIENAAGAFDVSIAMPEGDVYTGEGQFKVTVDAPEVPEGGKLNLFHIHDGEAKEIESEIVDGKLTFVTPSFSDFVYTVDFHYAGQTEHIEGGSQILLSELIEKLNILDLYGDPLTMDQVENVIFSDETLLTVEKVSGEVEVNGETVTVEDYDFLLTSKESFDTYENLEIYLYNGDVIRIGVSDASEVAANDGIKSLVTGVTIDAKFDGTNYIFYPNQPYGIHINFAEVNKADGQFPMSGSFTYQLPSGFIPSGASASNRLPITLSGGDHAGEKVYLNFTINDSGLVTFTWDETTNPAGFAQLRDALYTKFHLDIECIYGGSTGDLNFGNEVVKKAEVRTNGHINLGKKGTYNPATNCVDYEVTVNSDGITQNIIVQDTVTGTALTYKKDATATSSLGNAVPTPNSTDTGFSLTIPRMADGETISIKYSAAVNLGGVTDNGQGSLGTVVETNNKVKVTGGNPDVEIEKSGKDFENKISLSNIGKSGEALETDENGHATVNWTIHANDYANVSMAGHTISDSIDGNSVPMTYNGNGIYVTAYRENGEAACVNHFIPWTDSNMEKTNTSWVWHVPNDSFNQQKLSYVITYTTDADVSGRIIKTNVKNTTGSDIGGSASVGVDVTPPGGGLTARKKVIKTDITSKTVTWEVSFDVPENGLDSARIRDTVPNYFKNGQAIAYAVDSYIDGTITISPELAGGESYVVTTEGPDASHKEYVVIDFYKTVNQQVVTGLSGTGSKRKIRVQFQTEINDAWVQEAVDHPTDGNALYHTNNADVILNGQTIAVSATTRIDGNQPGMNKVHGAQDTYKINGNTLPAFPYTIVLTGVSDDSFDDQGNLILEDTFNSKYLAFYPMSEDGKGDNSRVGHIFASTEYKTNPIWDNNAMSDASVVTSPSAGKILVNITRENIPMNGDSYYPYYYVYYYLTVKDPIALEKLEQAIQTSENGVYEFLNKVSNNYFGTVTDTVSYEIPVIDKSILKHGDQNAYYQNGNYMVDFELDINPNALTLGDEEELTLIDDYTNLALDYTTIRIVKVDRNNVETPVTDADGVTWDRKGNRITAILKNSEHYRIYYSARITGEANNEGKVNYSNTVEFFGVKDWENQWQNITTGGDGTSPIYGITVFKHVKGNASKPLPGTRFKLYKYNAAEDKNSWQNQPEATTALDQPGWTYVKDLVTDAKGVAKTLSTDQIQRWTWYKLIETEAPTVDGQAYQKKDFAYVFWITESGQADYEHYVYLNDDVVAIDNEPVLPDNVDLGVTKTWTNDNGDKTKRRDITVRLYADGVPYNLATDSEGTPLAHREDTVQVLHLNSDGTTESYTWSGLPGGPVYSVVEDGVPGYTTTYSSKGTQVGGNINIKNKYIPGKTFIHVEKDWSEEIPVSARADDITVQLKRKVSANAEVTVVSNTGTMREHFSVPVGSIVSIAFAGTYNVTSYTRPAWELYRGPIKIQYGTVTSGTLISSDPGSSYTTVENGNQVLIENVSVSAEGITLRLPADYGQSGYDPNLGLTQTPQVTVTGGSGSATYSDDVDFNNENRYYTLSAANGWKLDIDRLVKEDADGKYIYYIEEVGVNDNTETPAEAGYHVTYTNNAGIEGGTGYTAADTVTVTNAPLTVDAEFHKTWTNTVTEAAGANTMDNTAKLRVVIQLERWYRDIDGAEKKDVDLYDPITLFGDTSTYQSKGYTDKYSETSSAGDLSGKFEALPKKGRVNGETVEYIYKIVEKRVFLASDAGETDLLKAGVYSVAETTNKSADVYNSTANNTFPVANIDVTKDWKKENEDGSITDITPDAGVTVTVQLQRRWRDISSNYDYTGTMTVGDWSNYENVAGKTLTLTSDDWTGAFAGLPVYGTREEQAAPNGFSIVEYDYRVAETGVTINGKPVDKHYTTAIDVTNVGHNDKSVTITNTETEPQTGSLKLTKLVTVNGNAPSASQYALVDGDYTFTVTGPDEADDVVVTVVIKVENGVAAQYKLNDATSFTNLPSDKYVVISELAEGDYTIAEADPGTDMTVSNITGGVDNTANTDARTVTVHVTAGEDAPAVGSKGAAAYTNDRDNLVDIEATKTWLQSDATTELNTTITHAEVTYTLHKKIGRNGTWAVASDVPDYQKKLEVTDTADANAWKTSWTGLDKYSGEDRIYYKVVESDAKVNGISIALPATSEAEAQNYQAVENHDNLTAVVGLTNTLPTTTVSGTKTWNIVSDTIPDNPTLILKRVSAKQGSAVETVTVPDGQLVWSGEGRTRTYTYSDLPKYDDGGYLYTYSVEESQFTAQGMTYETVKGEDGSYAVTPNTTDAPPALYSTTQDGNDIVNTELTTAQVTKQWAGATSETDNKIGSITYQISRTVDGHPDTSYSPENVTVTYAEAVSNNKGWGNTWSNLPAYGKGTYVDNEVSQDAVGKFEYTVAETKFVYDGVTYNVATDGTVTADTQAEGYDANKVHKFLRTSSTSGNTTAITNILDETYLDVIKKWSLNGNPATDDTEDTIPEISFYLYRNDGKIIDSASPTREAKAQKFDNEHQDGAKPFTIQKKPKTGSDTEYEWKLRIDKLEKTGSDGKPYTYWIQEVSVPGYSTSPGITRVNEHQQEVTVGSGDNAAPAESEITITNSKFTVSLPATGGTGTTIFYGAGLSLMLFAFLGFILNARKRSRGEGI